MAYTAGSFVADEQPTTAKWNYLWSNDAAFNDGSGFATGALGSVQSTLANGIAVQFAYTSTSAVSTDTTAWARDDTIPQITEGVAGPTLAFTPKSATNVLRIQSSLYGSSSIANQNLYNAIFQSGSTDALAVAAQRTSTSAGTEHSIFCEAVMVAGTTSSITFSIRGGGNGAGTTTINGSAGFRLFGTTPKSWISITEFRAT